jgi:hypothetical protein
MDLKCAKSKKLIFDNEESEFRVAPFENSMKDSFEDIEVAPDDLLKDHEYLQETKTLEEWDCETILTAASTWDNRPKVIRCLRKKSLGSGRSVERSNTIGIKDTNSTINQKIILQGKLQLPGDTKKNRILKWNNEKINQGDDVTMDDVKNTSETKEEKKRRKAKVKEDKRTLRVQKKQLKQAFTGESAKIVTDHSIDHISIFKYSN